MGKSILAWSDTPTANTGFGVVANNLLTRWEKMGWDISVLGVNGYGDPYNHEKYPFNIYPTDKGGPDQVFAFDKFWYLAYKIKPNIIFLLNDPWLIHTLFEHRPEGLKLPYTKIIGYYPIDSGPLKPMWAKTLTEELDAQICYSHFAEGVIREANDGVYPDNLKQIYHGVDTDTFFPIYPAIARQELGLSNDWFIVGMVARNQYRKRFDILMKAFAEFSKDKPNAKLYLHTAEQDIGYDIGDLTRQFNLLGKMIKTEDITPVKGVPENVLNLIYNTFDVHALISLGDGFGLPVAESMATQCPQLVSDHSCLKELVEAPQAGLTVKNASWLLNTQGVNTWGGVSDVMDIVKKLNILYENKDLRIRLGMNAFNYIRQPQFNWDEIALSFQSIFNQTLHIL